MPHRRDGPDDFSLEAVARRRMEERRTRASGASELAKIPLLDFVPRLNPGWEKPTHLKKVCDVFERIKNGESLRVLLSVPPQHGKTETILHGLTQLLLMFPGRLNAFATYNDKYAQSRSRIARDYALAAGVELRSDSTALGEWRTVQGGGLLATGVGGSMTGYGMSGIIIVDDPHKGRDEAESAADRERVSTWFASNVRRRVHMTTSIIVLHTRWSVEDLIGQLSREKKSDGTPAWEYINIPAINDDGTALWPSQRPLSLLEEARRSSELDWWSMYMGEPRPRGGALFGPVNYFTRLPSSFQVCIGVDLAYTAKTHADFSVAVVLAKGDDQKFYILDVVRKQVAAPDFSQVLSKLCETYPGAPVRTYATGPERGSVDFMRANGIPIFARKGQVSDKYVRAQPVAAAWRAGRVLVPASWGALKEDADPEIKNKPPEWVGTFVSEVTNFTGIGDEHDDQVDALAPAYDTLRVRASGGSLIGGGGGSEGLSFEDRSVG